MRRAFERGSAYNIGTDHFGLVLRVMPSALLQAQSLTLWNVGDGSLPVYATVAWSLSQNTDLIVGANAGLGPTGTEFWGTAADQLLPSGRPAGIDIRTPDSCYAFLKRCF